MARAQTARRSRTPMGRPAPKTRPRGRPTASATSPTGPRRWRRRGPPAAAADPCGTADTDRDGIKNAATTTTAPAARRLQDRQRHGGLRRRVRQAPRRLRQRLAAHGAEGLRPASGRRDDPGRRAARRHPRPRQGPQRGDHRRKLQTGQFFRGRFQIRQVTYQAAIHAPHHGHAAHRLVVPSDLRRQPRLDLSARRSKRRVRRLFGNAKGNSARVAGTPPRPCAGPAGASRTAATARSSRSRAAASRSATRSSARP